MSSARGPRHGAVEPDGVICRKQPARPRADPFASPAPLRYRLLAALEELGEATARECAEKAGIGLETRYPGSTLSNLAISGLAKLVRREKTRGIIRGVWSITDKGRAALRGERAASSSVTAWIDRERRERARLEHLERQHRMGLTDEQIAAAESVFAV